jgi:hypothetical protein
MLRFLIALAVLVSSVQCAAACTPIARGDGQPPCHHHKQAPASPQNAGCAHNLIPAGTVQSSIANVLVEAQIVEPFAVGALVHLDIPIFPYPSPPLLTGSLPFVLRI